MPVRFGLLGDVEVLVDGHAADVGHARQRCVLAALLVDVNRTVSTEQLTDRVWGDRPPPRARESLYSYLSRLRQSLGGVEGVGIAHRSGGYVLTAEPATVDLHRFRELVTAARRRVGTDGGAASALFEEALGLWRGTPFADLDTPWSNSLRVRVEDERLSAELDRNELRLAAGEHVAVLSDLAVRVLAHPLDERLTGQLMLALYRCGRQADALDHFQRLRLLLADTLGADPAPELRRLHQRILSADPSLMRIAEQPQASSARVVPRQLPAPPSVFTGRVAELDALTQVLADDADERRMRVVAISGVGGLGKSRLALRWAHQHLDLFPDGQLYVDLRGFDPTAEPMPTSVAVRGFLDALGVPAGSVPSEPDAQAALYRSRIAGARILVVLDNARDTGHVVPLLPGSPTCAVLVTSRHQLAGLATAHGARLVNPEVLDPTEARGLLADALGDERVAAEPDAVADLVRHCAGLPLALAILAARAAANPDFPLTALTEELRDASGRLDALDGGEVTANLSAVFASSLRALDPAAVRMFGLAGLTTGPDLSLAAVANLTGVPEARARVLLRQLEAVHLVRQHVPGRYWMHDLVRLYAARQARHELPADERAHAVRRLVDLHLHTAVAGDRLLAPHRAPVDIAPPAPGLVPTELADHAAAVAWFDTEHDCLAATQRLAMDNDLPAQAWQLAWALSTFHGWRGRIYDDLGFWRTGLDAAKRSGDPAATALAHRFLGRALGRTGRFTEALPHLRHAVALLTERGDRFGAAHTHRSLAWVRAQQGNDRQALEHATEALRLYEELDAPDWAAEARNLVGWHHALLGEYEPAEEYCTRALAAHRAHGNNEGTANALDSLGYIAHHTDRPADAVDRYREALAVYRELGDATGEANTLARLGDAHADYGQPEQADRDRAAALELYRLQGRAAEAARIEELLAATPKVTGPKDDTRPKGSTGSQG